MKIVKPSVELLWITPFSEKQIEIAGRTCYKSEDKITKDSAYKFSKMMFKSGHHAMIEHAVASFKIITDRGISHEIVRHRLASYAQESSRYCNYSKDKFGNEISIIEPPNLSYSQKLEWKISCEESEKRYFSMIKFGCKPEIARSVLPNCLKTEIVMSANLREFLHFIKLRSSKSAHPQIRIIAHDMCEILVAYVPSIFEEMWKEIKNDM